MGAILELEVAEKKPKKYGTLIRVSLEFASAMKDVTGFEKISTTEFCDTYLLPIVRKRYRNGVKRKAKDFEEGNSV